MISDLVDRKVPIAAPPFFSHFNPILIPDLASAQIGAAVTIVSKEAFRDAHRKSRCPDVEVKIKPITKTLHKLGPDRTCREEIAEGKYI